jgi:quinol monooxygenase YgiN
MYGTIGIFKIQPGSEEAAANYFNSWWTDRAPNVNGAISGSLHRNDANPSEFILSVVFASKEAYEANAASPEQDTWYQGLRALLSADPRWMDGEVLGENHA